MKVNGLSDAREATNNMTKDSVVLLYLFSIILCKDKNVAKSRLMHSSAARKYLSDPPQVSICSTLLPLLKIFCALWLDPKPQKIVSAFLLHAEL